MSKRSTITQFSLVIIIVIIAGLVIFIYPDPYTPLDTEETNRLFIQTVLVTNLEDINNNSTYLVGGIEIGLDLVTSSGLRNAFNTETNSSGVVEIYIASGTYRMRISNWISGNIVIDQHTNMNVTRYEFAQQPSSIDVFSLSKNWTISEGDVLDTSFTNELGAQIVLGSVLIGNQKRYVVNEEIAPAAEWQNTYPIPSDVSIPWSTADKSQLVMLQISYTEVIVDA